MRRSILTLMSFIVFIILASSSIQAAKAGEPINTPLPSSLTYPQCPFGDDRCSNSCTFQDKIVAPSQIPANKSFTPQSEKPGRAPRVFWDFVQLSDFSSAQICIDRNCFVNYAPGRTSGNAERLGTFFADPNTTYTLRINILSLADISAVARVWWFENCDAVSPSVTADSGVLARQHKKEVRLNVSDDRSGYYDTEPIAMENASAITPSSPKGSGVTGLFVTITQADSDKDFRATIKVIDRADNATLASMIAFDGVMLLTADKASVRPNETVNYTLAVSNLFPSAPNIRIDSVNITSTNQLGSNVLATVTMAPQLPKHWLQPEKDPAETTTVQWTEGLLDGNATEIRVTALLKWTKVTDIPTQCYDKVNGCEGKQFEETVELLIPVDHDP